VCHAAKVTVLACAVVCPVIVMFVEEALVKVPVVNAWSTAHVFAPFVGRNTCITAVFPPVGDVTVTDGSTLQLPLYRAQNALALAFPPLAAVVPNCVQDWPPVALIEKVVLLRVVAMRMTRSPVTIEPGGANAMGLVVPLVAVLLSGVGRLVELK
jgi:hypothetical protein